MDFKSFSAEKHRKRLMKQFNNCDIDSKIQIGFQNNIVRLMVCCIVHAGNKAF